MLICDVNCLVSGSMNEADPDAAAVRHCENCRIDRPWLQSVAAWSTTSSGSVFGLHSAPERFDHDVRCSLNNHGRTDRLFGKVVGAEPGSRWATAVDARPSRANRSTAGPSGPGAPTGDRAMRFSAPCSERPAPTPSHLVKHRRRCGEGACAGIECGSWDRLGR